MIETTSFVSDLLFNLGVIGINITNNTESILYEFRTKKSFKFNGEFVNLSNYTILFENGMLSLDTNSELKLTLVDNQPYIIKPNYSGFLDNNSDNFRNLELNILLLFMKEMIITNDIKINTLELLDAEYSQRGGCSFWNTYYVVATGGSRSVAATNLKYKEDDDVEGCREIGDADSSCVWDDHLCIATQAYCCD